MLSKSSIKVSCIIAAYNLSNLIEKCIHSLLIQTLKEIEIIIVNDCSTDNTEEILMSYNKKYENIKVLNLNENIKQGGARNRGLEIAVGEFVIFIDGDDWIEKRMLEKLYKYAKLYNLDIVDSDYYQQNKNGNWDIRESIPEEVINRCNKKELILNCGRICTKLIKRELLLKNNIAFLERKKFEDNPYLPILMVYTNKIGKLNEPFYRYVYNKNSTSRKKMIKVYFNVWKLRYF